GLADRAQVLDLFDSLMGGDINAALANLRNQYDSGADPVVVLQDLLELTHWLTTIKLVPDAGEDVTVTEAERSQGREMAAKLSMPDLTRCWQVLLKGLGETRAAPTPIAAAEMVLIRLAYAADLPDPADLVRKLKQDGSAGPAARPASSPPPAAAPASPRGEAQAAVRIEPVAETAAPAPSPADFNAVVALFGEKGELILQANLINDVHLVRFDKGRIEVRPGPKAPKGLVNDVQTRLSEWTGQRWIVAVSREDGAPPLAEQRRAREESDREEAEQHPLVLAAKQTFPGAEIRAVRDLGAAGQTPPGADTGDPEEQNDGDLDP
ncbi:MAG: hypothetical protein MI806_19650, partial [Minwuiales bacterium]|nr:hypothetical protein [Minwuiales bacterium]